MLIEVPPFAAEELEGAHAAECSEAVRARVTAARSFKRERVAHADRNGLNGGQEGDIAGLCRAERGPGAPLEERSHLAVGARRLLRQALIRDGLSGRGYSRVIDLARTIADLDAEFEVGADHVAEALSLRLDYHRLGQV